MDGRGLLPVGVESPGDLVGRLADVGYLADEGLATAAYLALRLHRPLFCEGEAGVGKTELAKALASVLGAPLIRLQCYEGIDASQALYDWDFPRQLLHLRAAEAAGGSSTPTGWRPSCTVAPVPDRPAAAAGAGDHPVGAAGRRGRPGRRRVRGVPARGALATSRSPCRSSARCGPRSRRRSWSPPTAPATCTTRSSAAATTTGWTTRSSTARSRSSGCGCRRPRDRLARRSPRRRTRCATPTCSSRRGSPRPSTGPRRWPRSARRGLDPGLAAATLGAVLKYREDVERVRALDVGALVARAVMGA